jgi:hypothetical protein
VLNIDNDGLRIAVVSCLFVIPLDELSLGELSKICTIMSQCSNVGAGQMEIILSIVSWIFYKLTDIDMEDLEEPIEDAAA